MTKPSFQEWFCLAENRKNFQIDPMRDQEFLFGEPAWEEEINSRLRRSQLLGLPVRLVWWGQYGIGKTHRLRHTQHLIAQNDYRYFPRYVVASDIQDKTGFEKLHFDLVNSLGRDDMREMVAAYTFKLRAGTHPNLPPLNQICGAVSDVESALRSFGGDNENLTLPAWRFLCGMELKGNEMALANVTKQKLDSSAEFAAVIGALATIIQLEMQERELLYLVDEVEHLSKITNKTAETRWQESIRAIADLTNVSLIFTIGADRQEGIPKIVLQPDIVRRFQRDNYIQMDAFKTPAARSFVRGLLSNWIDPTRRSSLEVSEGLPGSVADYDPELYPFTNAGFEQFCEYATADMRTAKPSEILARLNNAAAEAYFRDRRLLTPSHLTELGMG